jgi:archaellum component FlaC
MQTMTRESWTDERLDDLNGRVSDGFRQVDACFGRVEGEIRDLRCEMNDRFDRVEKRFERIEDGTKSSFERIEDGTKNSFERVEERLDSIQRLIAFGAIAMSGSFLAGFAALASQL